jgi:predicted acetyltransferase
MAGMMTVLQPITLRHRPTVSRLWQLFQHDLSEFRGTMPDSRGRFKTDRLRRYLSDADRTGYLFRRGPHLAGFALIRGLAGQPRVMGEFFVVRAARRQRIGHHAALAIIERHPGTWEIAFQEDNLAAARFWRAFAAGRPHHEERRPVPDKPDVPPDTWLVLAPFSRA